MLRLNGILSGCSGSGTGTGGVVVADRATADVLTDDDLMARNRLELPFGFDPATARR